MARWHLNRALKEVSRWPCSCLVESTPNRKHAQVGASQEYPGRSKRPGWLKPSGQRGKRCVWGGHSGNVVTLGEWQILWPYRPQEDFRPAWDEKALESFEQGDNMVDLCFKWTILTASLRTCGTRATAERKSSGKLASNSGKSWIRVWVVETERRGKTPDIFWRLSWLEFLPDWI